MTTLTTIEISLGEEDEGAGVPVRAPAVLSLVDFLAWVIGCVRVEGWVTKNMVGLDHPFTTGQCGMESGLDARKQGQRPPEADLREAEEVVTWANT